MPEIDRSAAELDLKFVSGDDFSINIGFPEEITGDIFLAGIVKNNEPVVSFTLASTSTASLGTVNILLTDIQTAELFGAYDWYFERTRGTETRTLIAGRVGVVRR